MECTIEKKELQVRMLHHPARDDIKLSDIFHSLSDPTRQSIVKELAEKTVLNAKNFELDIAKSTLSHHLKVLRESGLTQTRLSGTMCFVSLRREDLDARFPGLLDAILSACAKEEQDASIGSAG
jgi:DNA-binding transcriptional ArsR family regulator